MTSRSWFAKLFLVSIAAALCGVGARAQQAPDAAKAAWGFDRSDLTPHPGVRFGVLANGMRYALMRNGAPTGSLSVRLRIDAGSTVEGAREHGFMHLLEHLVFHGSANLPKGALLLMLPHQGLKRWSDFNGFTGYDETVYRLDLSRADRGARQTALMLMREVASHLRFERTIVAGAKEMVRQEIQGRDAVQDAILDAQNAFFAPGSPIARGFAGTEASIKKASGSALRGLYQRHYVPGRSTLVLVGDFDPAVVEAEIAARFSDWRAGTTAGAALSRASILTTRGTETHLFIDPAAPTSVTIAAVEALGAADAGAGRDAAFLAHLGTEMLNRRLTTIAAAADAPFVNASAAIYDHFATARMARIDVEARDRDWRGALQAGARALRNARDKGFSQTELDAQLAISRGALAGAAAPRTSAMLADAAIDAVGRKIVFTAPADASISAAYLARIQLAQVNAAFRAAWANQNRLIFVSHAERVPDGKSAIAAAWSEVHARLPQLGGE